MAKLLMLRGLPASGKSTRAKQLVGTSGNYVRVNRDLLRTMLHYDKWSPHNESKTIEAEKALVTAMLSSKWSVIVDDTNLAPKHLKMWSELAEAAGATFEVERMDTAVDECVLRDIGREKAVGRHVIVNKALQYGLYPRPEKGFVLCDLDGTLCDITHRLHHLSGKAKKDWHGFFSDIPGDTPRYEVMDMLRQYKAAGHEVIFVSARPEQYRDVTEEWIGKAFNWERMHETLIMRKDRDSRDDTLVKQEIYDTYFKNQYPIEVVIDDRPKVIRMWRSNGLNVIDVGPGIDF